MFELNPIARYMVATGSDVHLILYKFMTMGLSCSVLYALRRHRRAELGAWVCAALLLSLMFHWVRYNNDVVNHANAIHLIASSPHEIPTFVHIPTGS